VELDSSADVAWVEKLPYVRKEGVRLFRLALSIDDSDPETLAWVSITSAFMVGDSEREIEMADRAVALNPNFYTAWLDRGWVYRVAGQPEEAIRSFELAIRKSPVDPQVHLSFPGMGYALVELRRFDEAIVAGRKALRQNPSIRRLTAALSPISDVMLKLVRRQLVCLRPIPPLQYLRGSLGAGNQTRSC
jgi:tetratricopeptide (TPR) repeat protein